MNQSDLLSIFESLGLGIFVFYLIRGLKQKIAALEGTVTIQNKTLEVMEKRIHETEKVGDIYRNLMSNLPQDLDNYKTILSKTKDETILELKNQQEATHKKLEEAQRLIGNSKQTPEVIGQHLKVLKNMLSKPEISGTPHKKEYDIAKICEYGNRTLEQCVPLIVRSRTLEEFLKEAGFDLYVSEDMSLMNKVFRSEPHLTPKGLPIQNATSTQSSSGGWHLIANDEFYVNQIRLDELKDEFSAIKTIA